MGVTTASLFLAATVGASAQSNSVMTKSNSVTSEVTQTSKAQLVAGGAAGQMPYATYAWHNMMARLGADSSDRTSNPPPSSVADAR
jgi:hypothetical protein